MNKRATKKIDIAATGRGRTFQSQNPRLQEYLKLSEEQQLEVWQAARQQNLDWLTRTFTALQAGWIMVIDGEVTRYGASLGDFPSDEELTRIEHESGKFPFVFLSDDLVAVEESAGCASALILTAAKRTLIFSRMMIVFRRDDVIRQAPG